MRNWIDLHMHSLYSSDGTYSPQELIDLCQAAGLKVIALTDHNSVSGVNDMIQIGKKHQIDVISGIEFDCQFQDKFLHILCYGFDPLDERLKEHETKIKTIELAASEQLIRNVKMLGIQVNSERVKALSRDGTICGEMIAEVALSDPKNDRNMLLAPYRSGGERSNNPLVYFYWDHCAPGKDAYAYIDYPSLQEVVQLIKLVRGFAVLAHPGANVGRDIGFIQKLKFIGIGGIEVYSSYHSCDDILYFGQVAKQLGLTQTIGSDFHGQTKPAVHMADFEIEKQTDILNSFLEAIHSN